MNRITRSTNSDQRQTVSPPEGDTWETALDKRFTQFENTVTDALMTKTGTLIDKFDKVLSERFNVQLKTLENKLTEDFNESTNFILKTAQDAVQLAREAQHTVDTLKKEIEILTNKHNFMKRDYINLGSQISRNELYSRKVNLIFTCKQDMNHDCNVASAEILCLMNTPNMEYETTHFLRDKKQVIIKFKSVTDRDIVWSNRSELKNSLYFVSEDLPAVMQHQHNKLLIIAKEARKIEAYNGKVYLNADKLKINGRIYTCDTINQLPEVINPLTLSKKENNSTLCFGGRLSSYNPLSNFFNCSFFYKNVHYSSSEQALQHQKALKFNDFVGANEILCCSEPTKQKKMGRNVQNFDNTEWCNVRDDLLKHILHAKFAQNANCKDYLVNTGDKKLAEASFRDTYYGIGITINDTNVLNQEKWKDAKNVLGDLLINVRSSINN